MTDLILGQVRHDHPLHGYLVAHGARPSDLRWFEDNPGFIDILGLDYYLHSEMDWAWSSEKSRPDIAATVRHPNGFASIAREYADRYKTPIMLTETNIVGTVQERIAWLKLMELECEELILGGTDIRAFCWYPSLDTTDWSSGCTRVTGQLDPQGIWTLRPETLERVETELSGLYSQLARRQIRAIDIPAYSFGPQLQARVRGYAHLRGMHPSTESVAS